MIVSFKNSLKELSLSEKEVLLDFTPHFLSVFESHPYKQEDLKRANITCLMLKMRMDGLTFKEISIEFKVTPERVRQKINSFMRYWYRNRNKFKKIEEQDI